MCCTYHNASVYDSLYHIQYVSILVLVIILIPVTIPDKKHYIDNGRVYLGSQFHGEEGKAVGEAPVCNSRCVCGTAS